MKWERVCGASNEAEIIGEIVEGGRVKMEEHSDGAKGSSEEERVRDNVSANCNGRSEKAIVLCILFMLSLLSVTDAATTGPEPESIGNVNATSQLIVASLSTPPASEAEASRTGIPPSVTSKKLSQGRSDE